MASASAAEAPHRVHFYDDPAVIAGRIAAFLREAIVRGGAGIAVARPELCAMIEHELRGHCLDVEGLLADGRLVLRDADRELARFMDGDVPDAARFRARMLPLLDAARAAAGDPVHVYGEMVDALWERGQSGAVVVLERLWNELRRERRFTLAFGYRIGASGASGASGGSGAHEPYDVAMPGTIHDRSDLPWSTATAGDVAQLVVNLDHRARTLETEIARRERAESRMLRLLEVTAQLAAARTRDEIARLVVELGVEAVGSTSATLWRVTGDRLQLLGSSYPGTTATQRYAEITLAHAMPVTHAARTHEPVFLGSREQYRAQFPESFARMGPELPEQFAIAILPVICEHQVWGVACFTYDRERAFEPADRAYKGILARQIAHALERVQLHEEERAAAAAEKAAREEIELVYQLITAVNATDDLDAVYELTLDAVLRGSRSDRAAILLFDPDGVMRFKASRDLSEVYRRAVEGHTPWRPDTTDPQPVTVDDTETDPAWINYRDIFRAERIRSLAFVPLVHRHQLIGKLMLYRDEPRSFTAHEIQLTSTIAVHVAQAVERKRAGQELARAYREERDAHLKADEATRAREEILSVVSHDLRNPLGTVMMGASTLLGIDTGDKTGRVRTVADRIHRQAERMARMIDDLVDFAGIQAGQLTLAARPHPPSAIIDAAREMYAAIASEHGLVLEVAARSGLPAVECDGDRALQVIGNLVANAFKATPRGGRVVIGAEHRDPEVVFFVKDSGPGIDPDEMPNLFERFWRSKRSSYRGAGLGLSIARGIVVAHGGRIWAESQVGAGSTFYFSFRACAAADGVSNIPDACPR